MKAEDTSRKKDAGRTKTSSGGRPDGRLDGKKKEWKEGKRKMGCSAPKTP